MAIEDGETAMKFKWLPVVAADKCTGCGRCVEVCGAKCLEIAEGIGLLPRPDERGREEHLHHRGCRDDAIRIQWVPSAGNEAVGVQRWAQDRTRSDNERMERFAIGGKPVKFRCVFGALNESTDFSRASGWLTIRKPSSGRRLFSQA